MKTKKQIERKILLLMKKMVQLEDNVKDDLEKNFYDSDTLYSIIERNIYLRNLMKVVIDELKWVLGKRTLDWDKVRKSFESEIDNTPVTCGVPYYNLDKQAKRVKK